MIRHLLILCIVQIVCLSNIALGQGLCIQSGVTTNFSTLLNTNLASCGAGSSVNITNAGTTGVSTGNNISSVTPTAGGTLTVQIVNSSGNPCGSTISINVINTSFNHSAGSGCFGVALTAVGGNNPGCVYSYLIDGNWVAANASGVLNYNFNSGGSFPVRMRVQCSGCTFQSSIINVSAVGVMPALSFQGDTYLETTPVTIWEPLTGITTQTNNTNVVAYCVFIDAGVPSYQFPLQFSDASTNSAGATNYSVTFDGVNVYNGSTPPSGVTIAPAPSTQGYHNMNYSITIGGCVSTEVYRVYIAENSPLLMSLTPSGGFNCIGNNVSFSVPTNFDDYPSDTEVRMIVACNATLAAPLDTLYSQTWSDPSLVPNPILWAPTQASCNCTGGNFYVFAYASNPCYPSTAPGVTPFSVTDATAAFPHENEYCQGTYTFTWPSNINCTATHSWVLTNPSGVSTPLGNPGAISVNTNLNAPGTWTLTHTVYTTSCGSDTYTATICVSDNIAGTVNWGSAPAESASVCFTTPSITVQPQFNISPGLFLCPSQNVTYNWSVTQSACSSCDATEPCFTITGNGTINPTITLSCACTYTITCTVTGCGPNISSSRTFTLVAPPVFTVAPDCLAACVGQPWQPDGCITIDACNGGALTTSQYQSGAVINSWTTPITFNSTGTYPITLNAATTAGGISCPVNQNIQVIVSNPPAPVITGITQVCPNTPFSLTASTCSGVGQWSVQNGGPLSGAPTDAQISNTTTFVYECNIGGCVGMDTHQVQVANIPTGTINSPAINPCAGSPVNYSATINPPGAYSYQWSLNGTNTATTPTYSLTPSNNDVIGLTVGFGTGCTTTLQPVSVTQATVNVLLDCSIIPQPLCEDMDPFTIPVPVYPTGVVQDSVLLNGNLLSGLIIDPASLNTGNQTITFYYHDASGCNYTSSCSFVLSPITSVNITPDTDQICAGESLSLSILPASGSSLTWTSSPCPNCISSGGTFNSGVAGSYTITADAECVAPAQLTLDVTENPNGNITSPLNMCASQTLELTGTADPANSSVTWTVNGISTGNSFSPQSLGIDAGVYDLCMTVTDSNDCSVEICSQLNISNASAPLPSLSCDPAFDYFCYDMPCIPAPTPVVPAAWTLNSTTLNGNTFSQNQICAGSATFPEGTHLLEYELTDVVGCPTTLSCIINVHDTLDVTITYDNDLQICETESIEFNLNVDPGGFGTWSCSPCPTCINDSGVFTPVDITSPTVYTIVYDGPCVSHTSVQLTVNPKPNVTAVATSSLCINDELLLEGATSSDIINAYWQWNGNNISGNTLDPDDVGMTTGNTYEICLSGINEYGCTDTDCYDLFIEGLPDPIILDNDGWHCLDTPFLIPVNAIVNYSVVFTNTADNNVTAPYNENQSFLFPENSVYDYVITIASASNCIITQTGEINVLDNPVADIEVSDYDVCSPQFNLINNSTGDDVTYTWTGDLPFSNPSGVLPNPSSFTVPITPVDEIYEFQLSVSNNCSVSSDAVSITFQAPPQAFLDTLWIGDDNCSPFCVQLDADCPSTGNLSSVTYSWTGFIDINSNGNSITFPDLSTTPTVCFETQSAVTIPINVVMTNQCGQSDASLTAVVTPQQVEAEFIITESVCPGTSVPIEDNSFPEFGASVTFSVSPSAQGVYVENGELVILETATAGNYTVTQTVSGCGTDSESHIVAVGNTPDISLAVAGNIYCTGEPVVMNATLDEPIELLWNFGDGVTSVGYSNIEHIYYEAGTYNVAVSGISIAGCPGFSFAEVTVSGNDDFMNLSDSIFCGNNELKAWTSNTSWQSISWTLIPDDNLTNNPLVGVDQFEHIFINNSDTANTFSLQMDLTNLNGCISRDTRTIVVKPNTTVSLELLNDTICTIPFANTVVITDFNANWNYDFFIPDALEIIDRVNRIDAVFYSSQTVTVTARNQFGCSTTGDLSIECTDWPYYVPNIFTPDADGINDVFKPIFSNSPLYYELNIFDRWGEVIFSTTDPEKYWTGNNDQNGEHYVPNGVYVWQVEYQSNSTSQRKVERGHVSIVR